MGGAEYNVWGKGLLKAIDYQSGEIKWTKDLHGGAAGAGVLTTTTGLLFTGDSAGSAIALRTRDGATLWNSGIGRVGTAPVTYRLDGGSTADRRRFVAVRVCPAALTHRVDNEHDTSYKAGCKRLQPQLWVGGDGLSGAPSALTMGGADDEEAGDSCVRGNGPRGHGARRIGADHDR